MKLTDIEKVLLEQQDELEALKNEVLIHRPEEDLINLKSKLAQVVIGVRRSGKSTLCFNALRKAGVHYAYANFDDERLTELDTEDLDNVLQTLYKIYGKFDMVNEYLDRNIIEIEQQIEKIPSSHERSWDELNELFLAVVR